MWSELQTAKVSAYRKNVIRYRTILNSYLTPLERAFVEHRIAEEEAALRTLVRCDMPLAPGSENEDI